MVQVPYADEKTKGVDTGVQGSKAITLEASEYLKDKLEDKDQTARKIN